MAENRKQGNTAAETVDVWQDMREVRLPRGRDGDVTQYVRINNRTFLVPRGQAVQVPLPVYLVLRDSLMRTEEAEDFIQHEREA